MGTCCCQTRYSEFDAGRDTSRAWDKQLQKDHAERANIFKLLLLGTGNSGKSTFFKQLTQIHGGGLTEDDLRSSSKNIQDAIVSQMKNLLMSFRDPISGEFNDNLPQELFESATNVIHAPKLLSAAVADIEILWAHKVIKDAYENRTNLGISDNIKIFLDDLDRIKDENYKPTANDLIFARVPTTGMHDKMFTVNGAVFNIFDVGGQRSERSKWIHQFDTVHAVLFVSSLSCYDQMLYEQNDLNAMEEALELFSIVANSRYFKNSAMILFLNKSDIFKKKIEKKSLTVCFPEYDGGDSFDETTGYILKKFQEKVENRVEVRTIYHHITCFMDRDNVQNVFFDVQDTATSNALKMNGLI